MNRWIKITLLLFLLYAQSVKAQMDSVKVSLLTCAPGTEVYELFGHTALRYENQPEGQDWVFNYGMFSFETPHFILRFVKGETDYELGIVPYAYFEEQYAIRGSSVYQQELNLTSSEKQKLRQLLEENYQLQNRRYRYNYFYNNCTTRARDRIEECLDGEVIYPEGKKETSFRDIVHQYTQGHPWDELGIDLCLGSEADKPIDSRLQMFAPFYMLEAARTGLIIGENGESRPLVKQETTIVDVAPETEDSVFSLSPLTCVLFLLGLTCLMGWWQWKVRKVMWMWDICLYGAQGIAGCIIAFLFFFSVHPTVGSNWLVLLLNPVPLLYLPVMIYRGIKGKKDPYHTINVVYLTLFVIIMPLIPQKFNITVLPLTLCLLFCSASHILLYRRKHQ